MKKRKARPNRREKQPLRACLQERLAPFTIPPAPTAPPQMPRMPSPPRSSRDIVTLLAALTGLSLAARPDAKVELLPGSPTTVLVISGGQARATFILPVPREEVSRALGRPPRVMVDPEIDQLWMEEHHAG